MKTIKYPTNREFTIKQLLTTQNIIKDSKKKLTKVGLFLKIKRDVERGKLQIVGKKKHNGRGRPQSLYRVVEMIPTNEQAETSQTQELQKQELQTIEG